VKGVTLAESSMQLGRYEQWFYNTDGSDIHQTRVITRRRLSPRWRFRARRS
jgi:hypothetical protein